MLELVRGQVPLLIELKPCKDRAALCSRVLALLRQYDGPVLIESFDPLILAWFRQRAPHILRGQLTASYRELRQGAGRCSAFLVSRLLSNFLSRPNFIARSKQQRSLSARFSIALCNLRFVWTLQEEDDLHLWRRHYNGIIFAHLRP